MKKKIEKEKRELIAGLWGDGVPYSQVRVEREIRIVDRNIGREIYYVFANINPTTIRVLQWGKDKIKDAEILQVINEVKYRGHQDGYIYWPTDRLYDSLVEANQIGTETARIIEQMHLLVVEWLGLKEVTTSSSPQT
ncbi:MAG: hypothetical protein GX295_08375 [Syntrophomonadaceae bacterium]|nr:hypothetical protein [Syntrophomonadaceae bacterium]